MMRPMGTPPTPSAISKLKQPVVTAATAMRLASPSFIMEPSPNFSLIWATAASADFNRSSLLPSFTSWVLDIRKKLLPLLQHYPPLHDRFLAVVLACGDLDQIDADLQVQRGGKSPLGV